MHPSQPHTRSARQRGYTLLEYAAGAAILMGILYVGMQSLGGGIQSLLQEIGTWASERSNDLKKTN
jgi:hypothetical protein